MKTAGDILIVDDERDIRMLIGATLRDEGFSTMEAASAMEARDILAAKPPGLAILDIWMRDSDMDGLELLEWVKGVYPELPVLMISGHGTIETAVQAIRNGAYDFIEKPFKEDRLLLMVQRALEASRLERENAELRARVSEEGEPTLIGISSSMKTVRTAIERIAPTASRVLTDPKRPELAMERRAFHPDKPGHLRDIAVKPLQLRRHIARLKGLTRLSKRHGQQRINIRIARITRDVLNFRRKKVKPQRLGPVRRRHDHHIFNGVQHLPHIAGPPIALHPRQHLVTKLNPRKTGTPRHQIDKMAGQMRNC